MEGQLKTLKKPGKPGLKMKDLVKATGVAKSTLLYYVSLGLIPEPVKTSPNMAWYDPECITRVQFIQTMKREWGYAHEWPSSAARARALSSWLRAYNRRRPHSSLGDRPPISRVHNLCGQDT